MTRHLIVSRNQAFLLLFLICALVGSLIATVLLFQRAKSQTANLANSLSEVLNSKEIQNQKPAADLGAAMGVAGIEGPFIIIGAGNETCALAANDGFMVPCTEEIMKEALKTFGLEREEIGGGAGFNLDESRNTEIRL